MQIVIDIDEEVYTDAIKGIPNGLCQYSNEAIRNGTPLPKGHGDLIDLNALKGELWWVTDCPRIKLTEHAIDIWEAINTAKPVIPADK